MGSSKGTVGIRHDRKYSEQAGEEPDSVNEKIQNTPGRRPFCSRRSTHVSGSADRTWLVRTYVSEGFLEKEENRAVLKDIPYEVMTG